MSRTPLSRLRALPRVAGWVLASYLLVVAAASAAPWVASPLYSALCSAAGGAGGVSVDDALDCALCLPQQAGAPPVQTFADAARVSHAAPAARRDAFPAPHRKALPPARGPPSV